MVQPEMENHPILLSDYRNRHRVLGLRLARLAMRCLPGLARRGQLATPLGHDLLLTSFEPGLRRDVSDPAVQTHRIILMYKVGHNPSSVLQAERCQVGSGGVHPRIPA